MVIGAVHDEARGLLFAALLCAAPVFLIACGSVPGNTNAGADGGTERDGAAKDSRATDDAPEDGGAHCSTTTDCPDGQACDKATSTCTPACTDSQPCRGGCCDLGMGLCVSGTSQVSCGANGGACISCTGAAKGSLCVFTGCGCHVASDCYDAAMGHVCMSSGVCGCTDSGDCPTGTACDTSSSTCTTADAGGDAAIDTGRDAPIDTGSDACVPESLAAACGTLCFGTAVDNCGDTVFCTASVCSGATTCDETTQQCVACVPSGDMVASLYDCSLCCTSECESTLTICCAPNSVATACGTQCAGFASDGCSGTVDCSTNPCSTGTCDETTLQCAACVPSGDSVSSAASCSMCCSATCSAGLHGHTSSKCCTPLSVSAACGSRCAGTASDGCKRTLDCSTNTCALGTCDETTQICMTCVPPGDSVDSTSDCGSGCCSTVCSSGTDTCGCLTNPDCATDPSATTCDTTTNTCVSCVPAGHAANGDCASCCSGVCAELLDGGISTTTCG